MSSRTSGRAGSRIERRLNVSALSASHAVFLGLTHDVRRPDDRRSGGGCADDAEPRWRRSTTIRRRTRWTSMEDLIADTIAEPRFHTRLLGIFSLLALVLSAIGVYGVLASSVVERRREIGIRIALGADRSSVATMIVRRTLALAAIGVVLGTLGGLVLTRVLVDVSLQRHADGSCDVRRRCGHPRPGRVHRRSDPRPKSELGQSAHLAAGGVGFLRGNGVDGDNGFWKRSNGANEGNGERHPSRPAFGRP